MPNPLFHGTRADLAPGALIDPRTAEHEPTPTHVYLTPTLDEAIWSAELATGDGPARVYVVEPTGPIEDLSSLADRPPTGHPSMSWRSYAPLRVLLEFTAWLHYHGTRADLQLGDLIKPGYNTNYGDTTQSANFVYFARTLDAATWGAELAIGDGPGRIYIVEPTGPIEDDPNLTNRKFRGNPTKSFRSRSPLRVAGEVTHWSGHALEAIQAMKQGLEELARLGVQAID
jgi:hypothetical protein